MGTVPGSGRREHAEGRQPGQQSRLSRRSPAGHPAAGRTLCPSLGLRSSSEGRTHRGGHGCTATHPRLGSSEIPSLTEPLGPVSSSQPPPPTACSLDLLTEGIASV